MTKTEPNELPENRTYRAFLSYSRADDSLAHWLHRALEAYRTSKSLVGKYGHPLPRKLSPIFRDRTDLNSGGELSEKIKAALADSDALIVLCSPAAAQSVWVNREVEAFLALGRKDRIFPVIASGNPNSSDPNTECFPPALRGLGLIAADLRQIKRSDGRLIGDGKEGGRLKLISGLLGVTLDALIQRERQRQRFLIIYSTTAAAVFLLLAIAATVLGYYANENRKTAVRTLHGYYAANGRLALAKQDNWLAARYALAGMIAAPENAEDYRGLLGAANFHPAQLTTPARLGEKLVESTSVSHDGHRIIVRYSDDTFAVMDALSKTVLLSVDEKKIGLSDPQISSDGAYVVAQYESNDYSAIKVWDVASRAVIATIAPAKGMGTLAFSPDGLSFATVGLGDITEWDTRTGHRKRVIVNRDSDNIVTMSYSPDGSQIAGGSYGGHGTIWDAGDGHVIADLPGHKELISNISYSRDGRMIATASQDGTARVSNARNGQLITALAGNKDAIDVATFSHDGSRIATAGHDGSTIIWDATSGQQLGKLQLDANAIYLAAFSADDRTLTTINELGDVRQWDISALTESWAVLRDDVCRNLLSRSRQFTPFEISADPLLRLEWSDRDPTLC